MDNTGKNNNNVHNNDGNGDNGNNNNVAHQQDKKSGQAGTQAGNFGGIITGGSVEATDDGATAPKGGDAFTLVSELIKYKFVYF